MSSLICGKWAGDIIHQFIAAELDNASKIDESAVIYDGVQLRPKMMLFMEKDTFIGTNAVILVPKLVMERGSQINAGAILTGKQPIFLGRNSVVGPNVTMITASDMPAGKHMNDASPENERKILQGPIYVNTDSFIGANAVIMPDLTIGPRSVVGSGCYIDKPVPADTVIRPLQTTILTKRFNTL